MNLHFNLSEDEVFAKGIANAAMEMLERQFPEHHHRFLLADEPDFDFRGAIRDRIRDWNLLERMPDDEIADFFGEEESQGPPLRPAPRFVSPEEEDALPCPGPQRVAKGTKTRPTALATFEMLYAFLLL